MKKTLSKLTGLAALAVVLLAGCSGASEDNERQTASKASATTESGLTQFEQKHGIGPVKEVVTVGEIDMEKAEKGKELFKTKCSACHRIGERYVGPDLSNVLDRRSPTYVMNMVLNPDEMVKKHPEAKKMLAEFLSPMPNQNLEMEEARAIVEYLASVQAEPEDDDENEDEDEN